MNWNEKWVEIYCQQEFLSFSLLLLFFRYWAKKFADKTQKQPPEVFCKIGVLKNFAKFTGKHLRQSPRCLSLNFRKFLRTSFSIEHLWWLFLKTSWPSRIFDLFSIFKKYLSLISISLPIYLSLISISFPI